MNNTAKNALYSLILIVIVGLVYLYRESQALVPMEFYGEAMGSVYTIKYLDAQARKLKPEVDKFLEEFNTCLSTYDPKSEISRFNQGMSHTFGCPHFYQVLEASRKIYEQSGGAFDPTVGPLVNAWGFGFKQEVQPDSLVIDSLLQLVGFDKISFDQKQVRKSQPGIVIDFNSIAPGYAVDLVAEMFEAKGIQNYMIEISGEVRCKGVNKDGKPWGIAIVNPVQQDDFQAIIPLSNRALVTSGNYRKFYVKDGVKYSHTIDPKTGYPVQHSLLSATVLAPDATTADAMATVLMVLGLEEGKKFLEKHPELDALLIYSDAKGGTKTYITPELAKLLEN
ncbi:FAD:protein FMN transferase [Eisenibacter elegans]|jgi:thiamine biosynthesis lipoprotein|uniref:FAD:protein FMN transferase n=1 Tax=Eisenibacter elegans TaxID=997 RepID=UPI000413BAF9|nr:FAD:protein FMN transferase [Eisenibacter elegans]